MKRRTWNQWMAALTASALLLAGCGKQEPEPAEFDRAEVQEEEQLESETVSLRAASGNFAGGITVQSIKDKYDTSDDDQIKPFYNVEQTTQFAFHFANKDIEPCYAVTVHTDPKCEVNSMVYQINDGYLLDDGLTVVVKAGSPVLNSGDRLDGEHESYHWGNAPVYYLCIRYDMYSEDAVQLEQPIIVPFTIRNDISTPNVEADIQTDGSFELTWKPVKDAVEYRIYEANAARDIWGSDALTRAECGYVGDHLNLLATVDGDITNFSDFNMDNTDNTLVIDDYVVQQNFYNLGSYYVTAVDADGHESQFSTGICGWKYSNQLPTDFDSYSVFQGGSSLQPIVDFPEQVPVKMVDGTEATFPINYTKLEEDSDGAAYAYEIVGTKLTGEVYYYNDEDDYPDEVISSASVPYDKYTVKNDINIIPDNTVSTVDERYTNVDLSEPVSFPEETKIEYDMEALYRRADIESARIISDGVYTENNPFTIGTYKADGQTTEYVPQEPEENPIEEEVIEEPEEEPIEEEVIEEEEPFEEEVIEEPEEEPFEEEVIEEPEEEEPIEEEVIEEPEYEEPVEEGDWEDTEITSDNLVEEQIESGKREMEEANAETVPDADFIYFADSAEEEYLALMMIARQDYINLSAFPCLQNQEYLVDCLMKVVRQNPFIISPTSFSGTSDPNVIQVAYEFDEQETLKRQEDSFREAQSIIDQVITAGMSEEEKVMAVWNYLEANTEYDYAACEYGEEHGFDSADMGQYADAFNIYGIMCNKVGVCQSYSYVYKTLLAMSDVPCVTLEGYLDKTLPHAWNAVNIDGQWYWMDVTNNAKTTGIPYYLYQTSADVAIAMDYVLDDEYELNDKLDFVMSSDNSKDWYVQNNLYATDEYELADALLHRYEMGATQVDGENALFVKYNQELTQEAVDIVAQKLFDAGVGGEELNLKMGQVGCFTVAIY